MATPTRYDLTGLRRGDSVPAVDLATVTDGANAPVPIASALMQIRDLRDVLICEWSTTAGSLTITGADANVVHMERVPAMVTATWRPGPHVYDLEVTSVAGDTITVIEGTAHIAADISRRAS